MLLTFVTDVFTPNVDCNGTEQNKAIDVLLKPVVPNNPKGGYASQC